MVLDALSCANVGKISIRPSDLVPFTLTESVFGNFMVEFKGENVQQLKDEQ